MEYVTLQNGVAMPMLGYGTIGQTGEQITDNVAFALTHGYELIDTANRYGNEVEVGRGLKKSGLKRENYFLETKLGPTLYENETAIDGALQRLGVDYIDLMILHQPAGDTVAGYRILEKAHKEGKIRAIGLSNFNIAQTQRILDECEVVPTINQVECHPYFPQTELKELLKEHNIALQAWYPLGGRGNDSIMTEPLVQELAEKHGKSPAQVLLRWHIQQGHIVIPGSKTPSHIAQNIDLFDFALTDEDMAQIDSLDKGKPFFGHNDEVLAGFLAYVPDVEGQK